MPNTYTTLSGLFSAIANAVRAKTGGTSSIAADDFPTAISGISTGEEANLQSKSVAPSTSLQSVAADTGYDGLSSVSVSAVTSAIDSDITAGNIKSGVEILGVTGTYTGEEANLQSKSVAPSTSLQSVAADTGYDGLSSVSVSAVTSAIDANIAAAKIKSGVSILGVTGTYTGGSGGSTINGKLFDCGSFTPTSAVTSAYTISHSLGSTPSAAFLWVTNPSYATRGIVGKYRADTSSESNSASLMAVNDSFTANTGASFSRFRLGWSATALTVNCDATYPLLAGLTYQWLVIAQ